MVKKAEKNREKNNEEKEPNEKIIALKEKLKLKESQIKESFKTIEFLKKQNKKIKEDYDSLALDGKNINENNKLVEELREKNNELRELIKKKNNELRELEREYKNLISYKSGDEHLEQNKNLVNELKTLKKQNDENKAKITQLKQIVEKHQKKEMENKKNANLNFSELLQKKNIQAKIEKLKIKKGDKYEFIDFNNKKFVMNKNFSLLFNDLEKKTLFALFPDEGDFMRFNQKLDIIENNFNSSSKRFQTNINELKETIDDKEELIAYLREKIRENEMKIKILLNQIHLERNKNEKRANIQQQNSNDKNIINDIRTKSPKK
jgi:chromosome segregation ATPase